MKTKAQQYWRQNLIYLASLLWIWFVVSYGAGILFVDWLDQFRFGGFKPGFWSDQQEAISVIVAGVLFTASYIIYFKFINPKLNNAEH